MMKIVILLIVGLITRQSLSEEPPIAKRIANPVAAPRPIVGGQDATIGQFKHQVSIWFGAGHTCGGSIISATHIVTAAHCIPKASFWRYLRIITGTIKWKQGEKHKIKCIRVHPGYIYENLPYDGGIHDIAVITLKSPIIFNDRQAPIPLASKDYSKDFGTPVVVSGWGDIYEGSPPPEYLKWVQVKISACNYFKSNNFICAHLQRGKGFCNGDSGGPLIVNGELIGVVSNSVGCAVGLPEVPRIKESIRVYYVQFIILEPRWLNYDTKMMKIVILLVIGLIATQSLSEEMPIVRRIARPVAAPRPIVGGAEATEAQFKYQVSIWSGQQHSCGATIISPTHILTAGHCIPKDKGEWKQLTIVTGTNKWKKGQKHEIKCIRVHPEFTWDLKTDGGEHDIAVITVKKPITFNNVQAPIPLTNKDYANDIGTPVVVSGWGRTRKDFPISDNLKFVKLKISACRKVAKQQLCTFLHPGQGFCMGDSGGPLVANGELIGVVSHGTPCATSDPDTYTNVFFYKKFIQESQQKCP